MNKVLKVKCPICDTQFSYYSSEYRPFCSEKCKMVDLGHWLNQTYTIPVAPATNQVVDEFEEMDEEGQFFRDQDDNENE